MQITPEWTCCLLLHAYQAVLSLPHKNTHSEKHLSWHYA
jgi:hypothetical protein